MAGPIIREGIISLGVRLATPKLDAGPTAAALNAQTKAAVAAAKESDKASQGVTDSLQAQAKAEEAIAAADEASAKSAQDVANWKKYEEKQVRALASAVQEEANSKATSNAATDIANAKAQSLAEAQVKTRQAMQHAAHGALQLATGLALIATGSTDSLAKFLPYVFILEGASKALKGATTLTHALSAAELKAAASAVIAAIATGSFTAAVAALGVALGPVTLALIAIGVIVAGLAYIYDTLTTSEEEAKEAAQEHQKVVDAAAESMAAANERFQIRLETDAELIANLDTLAQKEAAYAQAIGNRAAIEGRALEARRAAAAADEPAVAAELLAAGNAELEHKKQLIEGALNAQKEQAQELAKEKTDRIQIVKHLDEAYKTAEKTLKVEEDKAKATRAQIGALKNSEQNKLKRLLEKADDGSLTRKQALDLQKLGGEAGKDIADVFLGKMDKGLGDLAEKTRAKVTGEDPRAKAQSDFTAAQKNLNAATSGKSAAAAIKELEEARDQITASATAAADELRELLRDVISNIGEMKKELSQARQGARQRAQAAAAP